MPSDLDFAAGDKADVDRSVGDDPSTNSTPIGHAARSVVAVNVRVISSDLSRQYLFHKL